MATEDVDLVRSLVPPPEVDWEHIEDLGDGRVLWLGQDTGTRSDGTGEIVMASSAIWTVKDDKVVEAMFFADRREGLRSAGKFLGQPTTA